MKKKYILISILIFIMAFTSACNIYTGEQRNRYTVEEARDHLQRLRSRDKTNVNTSIADSVLLGLDNLSESSIYSILPDFEQTFDPVVKEPRGSNYITVVSSTEKATPKTTDNQTDCWLIDMAEQFNRQNNDGYGVRLYGVTSGEAYDFISSGKYIPDVYSPSATLWGDALGITPYIDRLAGNVAGIVTKKDNPLNITKLHHAVMNEGFKFGYTNPNMSTTGYNFLLTFLSAIGEDQFEDFQRKIPFVAYTTAQMRNAAVKGVLDGFVYESQVFESGTSADAKKIRNDYIFTPYGVRHDNPVYILNDDKTDIVKAFVDFCLTEESQKEATRLGFNKYDDYKGIQLDASGINEVRALYKEKKSGGQKVVSVFVCDVSGSMNGTPMAQLKEGMLECAKYIDSKNAIGLVTYSSDVDVILPIADFDFEQQSRFIGAVSDLYPGGATATNSAITVALEMLVEYQKDHPNDIVNVFVLSDGETNAGLSFDTCKDVWQSLNIPIHTIGYNFGNDELKSIASLNEASYILIDDRNVTYALSNFFKAQM